MLWCLTLQLISKEPICLFEDNWAWKMYDKADGTKLKPFVVFCVAKRESKSLNE